MMTNKDTLYIYKIGSHEHFIGFCFRQGIGWSEGWSRKLSDFDTRGWTWDQPKKFEGLPIGQRCILQW